MLKIKVKVNSLIGKYVCYDLSEGQRDEEGKFTAYRIVQVVNKHKVKAIYEKELYECNIDIVTIRALKDIPKNYNIYHD